MTPRNWTYIRSLAEPQEQLLHCYQVDLHAHHTLLHCVVVILTFGHPALCKLVFSSMDPVMIGVAVRKLSVLTANITVRVCPICFMPLDSSLVDRSKDYLKQTLALAFEIFGRGVEKG